SSKKAATPFPGFSGDNGIDLIPAVNIEDFWVKDASCLWDADHSCSCLVYLSPLSLGQRLHSDR
ncbi:MAG: hypothetical protein LUP00_00520, partial [Methanothrix sp.]|nr:hypothetical protein [Methanothrix sp.]